MTRKKALSILSVVLTLILVSAIPVTASASSLSKTKNVGGVVVTAYGGCTTTGATSRSSSPVYANLFASVGGIQQSDQGQQAPIPYRSASSEAAKSVTAYSSTYYAPYEVTARHIIEHAGVIWEVYCYYSNGSWF